jgi:hypothetical protein
MKAAEFLALPVTSPQLTGQQVKSHKVRYYLERRDAAFEETMAEVLCVYREVAVLRAAGADTGERARQGGDVAIISSDEKPGIQAIGNTAPDLPPNPGIQQSFACDHEYKRNGTLSLLAGIEDREAS